MTTDTDERDLHRRLRSSRRWALALGATALALLIALAAVMSMHATRERGAGAAREAAIAAMVARASGVWDSHVDPDVARVLQPNLSGRSERGADVTSNAFGMRERRYAWDKPAGTVRVVLLGDSFVYGFGLPAEDRMGTFLERSLAERAETPAARIEVLHLAISSWNIRAECAYLRRQLSRLQPDLVVQLVVVNDLNDCTGARGFGGMARFSPQVRGHADGLVLLSHANAAFGVGGDNYLLYGLAHESRTRYAAAAADIARLSAAVERAGGRYLLLARWTRYLPQVPTLLAPGLRDDQVAYVSDAFALDPAYWLAPDNAHWNRSGQQALAKLLYGLARERELLPQLQLGAWDAAERAVDVIHREGERTASRMADFERVRAALPVGPSIDISDLEPAAARQVYAGIDGSGRVAPYASMVLARRGGNTLRLSGRYLDRPELDGTAVHVFVDEHELGTLTLSAGHAFSESWPLPAAARSRDMLNVRLQADDYVYADGASQRCIALVLERIAIER